jgi:hypothetical protein
MSQNEFVSFVAKWQKSSTKKKKNTNGEQFFFFGCNSTLNYTGIL